MAKYNSVFPRNPKRDQNPKFTPLSETTSIPTPSINGVSPPHPGGLEVLPLVTKWIEHSRNFVKVLSFTSHLSLMGRLKVPRMANRIRGENDIQTTETTGPSLETIELHVRKNVMKLGGFQELCDSSCCKIKQGELIVKKSTFRSKIRNNMKQNCLLSTVLFINFIFTHCIIFISLGLLQNKC